jgi:hypothetical protein
VISVLLSRPRVHGRIRGEYAQILSPFVALTVAFIAAPPSPGARGAEYYLARPATGLPEKATELECSICENVFERGRHRRCARRTREPICAVLHARSALPRSVQDQQPFTRAARRLHQRMLPKRVGALLKRAPGTSAAAAAVNLAIGLLLGSLYQQYGGSGARGARTPSAPRCGWCISRCCGVGRDVLAHRARARSRSDAEAESARRDLDAHGRNRRPQTHRNRAAEEGEVARAANVARRATSPGISTKSARRSIPSTAAPQLPSAERGQPRTTPSRVIRRSAETSTTDLIDGILDISRSKTASCG